MVPILPVYEKVGEKQLTEAIALAIGCASTCWEKFHTDPEGVDTGQFDEKTAVRLVNELVHVAKQFKES